jgi:hypothetical protein
VGYRPGQLPKPTGTMPRTRQFHVVAVFLLVLDLPLIVATLAWVL